MNLYNIEKTKLSSLQSSFHKLLNRLKNTSNNSEQCMSKLIIINDLIERLEANIIQLNESFDLNTETKLDSLDNKELLRIDKDRNTLNTFLPLILMYRMQLDV